MTGSQRGAPSLGTPTPPRRVIIVDDHRTFVELLRHALDGVTTLECVGVAYDPQAGIELVNRERPELVVLDYEFPGRQDGITAAATIRSLHPDTLVVLLTGRADLAMTARAAEGGLSALLPKDGSLPDLLDALHRTGPGGLLVHPSLLVAQRGEPAAPPLSPREREVLAMMAVGLTAGEIAAQLGITTNTCRGYIKSLLWKLGAHTQLEAVALARRKHLVADP